MLINNDIAPRKLIGGLIGGTVGIAVITFAGHAVGRDDFAKGAAAGGGAVIVLFIVAAIVGTRRSTAVRMLLGSKDERERAIAVRALADAGIAMFALSLITTIAGLWNIPALAAGGAVLFGGEVTLLVSLMLRLRRS